MPQYIVERTADRETGLGLPRPSDPPKEHLAFRKENARAGVIWVLSYLTADRKKAFCLYEAPDPAAIRLAASRNGLPIDRISEVVVQATYNSSGPTPTSPATSQGAGDPQPTQPSDRALG